MYHLVSYSNIKLTVFKNYFLDDHHEKARSIDALEKEIEKNKRKMVIADAGDLRPPLIEID